jgi:hypothetical protein
MRQGGGRVRSSVDLPPGVTAAEADGQYPRALMSLLAESGLALGPCSSCGLAVDQYLGSVRTTVLLLRILVQDLQDRRI